MKTIKVFASVAASCVLVSGCATAPAEQETPVAEEESTEQVGLIDYMKENPTTWMSVDNGYWSENVADQPTDEELTEMFETAMMAQLAVQYNEVYLVALKDYQDQFDVVGDYWDHSGKSVGKSVTEGTVTVLFYADKILPQEEHASTYGVYVNEKGEESPMGPYYQQAATTSMLDTGITIAYLQFAAHSLGYNTHVFGGLHGDAAENNPTRYIDGKNLMRGWGFPYAYGEDVKTIPVEGNMKLVAAVVIGKTAEGVDATTAASMHMRPSNYVIYDGVPGTPSDSETGATPETDSETGATEEAEETPAAQ